MPAGSVSRTVVTPEVGADPEFVTLIVHVPFVPTAKLPTCVLAMDRFGAAPGFTTVGSVTRSPDGSESPGVSTVAEFVTPGTEAAPTATVMSNDELAPTAIAPGWIAVTI